VRTALTSRPLGGAAPPGSGWNLDLEPMLDTAGAIERAELLRHDPFAAQPAGVLEDDGAVAGKILVQGNTLEQIWQ
jgi:hypothetical protein